jgi:hypothetical protein
MADENAGTPAPETAAGNPTPNPEPKAEAPAASWIPQELRGSASLTKFKTAEDALKAYINLEGAFGKKFEEHLKPDADPAVQARIRAAMGVPEAANGYEDVKLPEGYEVNKELVGSFKETAYKAGLSKSQANALQEWFIGQHLDQNTSMAAQRAQERDAAMVELDKRWGAAKTRNVAMVQQLVAEHGGAELKAALDETGAGNNPAVLEFLARMAGKMAEDNLMTPAPGGLTVEDAKKEMQAIRGTSQKDAYWNSSHPGHKQAVERMSYLTQFVSNAL